MSATNPNINYPRCEAKNHCGSSDAHSQNGAVTVLLSLAPIKVANTLVMHESDRINEKLL